MTMPLSPAPPRELSFELNPTFAEHLRAQRAAQGHGRGRQVRTQQRVGAVIGLALGLVLLYTDDGSLGVADWVLLGIVVALFLSPLPNILHVRRMRRAAGGPARVTLSEHGVRTSDARGANTVAWAAVRAATETDEFIVFDLDDAGGFFVPLRVLRETGVLDEARALIARGRGAAAKPDAAQAGAPPASPREAPGGPAVTVDVAPTLWEELAAQQQVWFRSRQGRQLTGYFIGAPLVLLALFRWSLGPQGVRDNLYLPIGGATAALVVIPALGVIMTLLRRGLTHGRVVPVRMTVDDAGLTLAGGGNSVTTAWPAIRRVQRAGGVLLFWIDRNTAHYLPLRLLGGAADEARRVIRRHAGDRAALG
ncbi:MAG TPA: YcxB family protein [Longimicrobium sp.]|uniref:YcxB family protein n=1 Tax=Longimicrobium sp. TaxID=2029185 RepID=UPI002EDB9C67